MSTETLPRKSALRLFWGFNGWFGLIFLLAGTGVLIGSGFVGLSAWRLAKEGEVVSGIVLGKDWRESRDSDGDTTTTYYLSFAFDTKTGERIEDENSVDYDIYRDANTGDAIDVRYWPQDPSLSEVDHGSKQFMALLMGVLGLPFFLVGAGFVTVQSRFALRAVRARDRGERVEAKVTEHAPSNLKVNGRRYYSLQWRDERGNIGKSRPANPARLEAYPPGSKITVYINPRAPLNGVWEGDVGPARSGYSSAGRGRSTNQSDKADRPPTVRRN